MSDVPLGVFLSGGIDSSALAAHGRALVARAAPTFSVGFAEREANELPYARHGGRRTRRRASRGDRLARAVLRGAAPAGLARGRADRVPVERAALLRVAPRRASTSRSCSPARAPTSCSSATTATASRIGTRGSGGRTGRCAPAASAHQVRRRWSGAAAAARPRYAERTFLGARARHRASLFSRTSRCSRSAQRQLLRGPSLIERAIRTPRAALLRRGAGRPARSHEPRSISQTYLHELLMKQDQMSMAASIESRVPFLDHRSSSTCGAAGALKLRGWQTKARPARGGAATSCRRRSCPRRKMGFPVPVGRWLRGAFQPLVDEFVLGPRAAARRLFDPTRRCGSWPTEHASGAAQARRSPVAPDQPRDLAANLPRRRSPEHVMTRPGRANRKQLMRILWVKMGGLWPPTTRRAHPQPADHARVVAAGTRSPSSPRTPRATIPMAWRAHCPTARA